METFLISFCAMDTSYISDQPSALSEKRRLTGCLKTGFAVFAVVPAKAGIQSFPAFLDSRLRGSDEQILLFSNRLMDRAN